MSQYFGRSYELFIGGTTQTIRYYSAFPGTEGLQLKFRVDQTPNAERSYAEITVYGVNRASRRVIADTFHRRVVLKAGYGNLPGEIFRGHIENVEIGRDGADVYAKMFCQSAAEIWRQADVSKEFGDNTPAKEIIRYVAEAFGRPVEFVGDFDSLPREIKGFVVDGKAKEELRKLAEDHAFSWMVDGDTLLLFKEGVEGRPDAQTFNYTPANGMIGTPQMTEKGVDISVLLNPRIRPYDLYTVRSETAALTFNAIYYQPRQFPETVGESRNTVLNLEHEGDFHGDTWQTNLTGQIPGGISAVGD